MKELTPEQKLDVALDFLSQVNEGSYLYPDAIKLKEHLISKGVPEKEHLPIILHLEWGEYLSVFYKTKDDKVKGEYPSQLKITFKGIKFQNKGGYTKLMLREKRNNIIEKTVKFVAILTFFAVLGNLFLTYQRNNAELESIKNGLKNNKQATLK